MSKLRTKLAEVQRKHAASSQDTTARGQIETAMFESTGLRERTEAEEEVRPHPAPTGLECK